MRLFLPLLLLSLTLPAQLILTPDGRYLQDTTGTPILLHGDTGWKLGIRLTREEVDHYLKKRQEQGFNTIGMAALFEGNLYNAYRDAPFAQLDGRWDPDRPATTPGSDPTAYDYWDHMDYAIDQVASHGMYAALVIAFNAMVVGNGRGERREQIVFNPENAYRYGRFIGARYGDHDHIIWMLGGDRSPVYGEYDYRPVYHAMAEGVADGTLTPTKPTWLFEGRYEEYTFAYRDWVARFQAYRPLTAGAFGHLYGNRYVWNYDSTWQQHLDDPGAHDMRHLYTLFTTALPGYGWGNWQPYDSLLTATDPGHITNTCWRNQEGAPAADFVTPMRSTDRRADLVYAANGRSFTIDMTQLAAAPTAAYWYSPRTGHYYDPRDRREYPTPRNVLVTKDADYSFDPPGQPASDNDWVLLLTADRAR